MKKQTVCVQGLGFVGVAMAVAIANSKNSDGNYLYDVIGVDLPNRRGKERVKLINNGEFPLITSDKKLIDTFFSVFKNNKLHATTGESIYADADIIVVDINLDISYLEDNPKLEFSNFQSALLNIGNFINEGALIIIETTVPPGTCEKIVVPTINNVIKKRGLKDNSVLIAHSYERVMPGSNYLDSIINYWRVYSGHTPAAAAACEQFFTNIINTREYPLTRLSSTVASESAKVLENTYRAVNIAFIDEWTKYAEAIGVDLFEIIDAIKKRPTHSNMRHPGLGVGGYCLTKDPTFAPAAAEQLFGKELTFPFSNMAVRVNNNMPLHTVNRINLLMNKSTNGKKILVCGISYRQDVGDTRHSPSETLVRELIALGCRVTCHDPYVDYWDELNIEISKKLYKAKNFDAVVVAVPHKQYRDLDLSVWGKGCSIILDANGVFSDEQRNLARKSGIKIESIGRGIGL